jgi:hypothetical protein
MISDTAPFNTLEVLALTALGESESLGEQGMTETICVAVNRAKANIKWMGGSDLRTVCLFPNQFDCWWPQSNNDDRDRIMQIGLDNPMYGPYLVALGIAGRAISGTLIDVTNGAVSYVDAPAKADVHPGSVPCLIRGNRTFYNLAAVA